MDSYLEFNIALIGITLFRKMAIYVIYFYDLYGM